MDTGIGHLVLNFDIKVTAGNIAGLTTLREGSMTQQSRIRLARRHAGLSQMQLAEAVHVQRSAVSHWESSQAKNPSVTHLREIATITGVQFEWLATGRGAMGLCNDVRMDSVPTAAALLIEEPIELRLLHAFRDAPPQSRVSLVEIVEQLATQRTGRPRESAPRTPVMQSARTRAPRVRRASAALLD
jgi:transcriptional regulator with XRE-family HTH domain